VSFIAAIAVSAAVIPADDTHPLVVSGAAVLSSA
jgi:hypothetical protein